MHKLVPSGSQGALEPRHGRTSLEPVPKYELPAGGMEPREAYDLIHDEIGRINADLAPLTSFVLPGGTPGAAHLHLARTVARRAERAMTALAESESVNPDAIRYINRLSDLLFVLARALNDGGAQDVLWEPGQNI